MPPAPTRPVLDLAPSPEAWERFAASHGGHFLQSTAWGRVRSGQGWQVRRLVLRDEGSGEIRMGAQVLVRGRWPARGAYLARGPVAAPFDPDLPLLWDGLRRLTGDCLVLRVEPDWADTPAQREALRRLGGREAPAAQPPTTLLLDLGAGEAAVLAGMKQKWRYNIGLAERSGVQVRPGQGAGDWAAFEGLLHRTAERNGFPSRPEGYYRAVGEAFGAAARLMLATLDGRFLGGILVLHWGGRATYLYGASSDEERRRMPNHLLQWRAIQAAMAEGCAVYDLWGIPDEIGRAWAASGGSLDDAAIPEPPDAGAGRAPGLWGVWGFKRGFGGRVWRSVGAWDFPRSALAYRVATGGAALLARLRSGR